MNSIARSASRRCQIRRVHCHAFHQRKYAEIRARTDHPGTLRGRKNRCRSQYPMWELDHASRQSFRAACLTVLVDLLLRYAALSTETRYISTCRFRRRALNMRGVQRGNQTVLKIATIAVPFRWPTVLSPFEYLSGTRDHTANNALLVVRTPFKHNFSGGVSSIGRAAHTYSTAFIPPSYPIGSLDAGASAWRMIAAEALNAI